MIQTPRVWNKHWNSFPKVIPTHSALRGLIFLLQLPYCAGILWSGCRLDVCVRVCTRAREECYCKHRKMWKWECVEMPVSGNTCKRLCVCDRGHVRAYRLVLMWECACVGACARM